MFTLILPTFSRNVPSPTFQTPALDKLRRFGQFTPQPSTTGQLYLNYLCNAIVLPENEVWASPVWLQMGMNSIHMTDGATIDISQEEAQSLCNGLNKFYQHQFHFEPIRPDLWRCRLPEKPQWQSPTLFDACGYQMGDFTEQAQGKQRNQWLQIQTEMQMWLHNHAINSVRQQNQKAPINGIWLWQPPMQQTFRHTPSLMGSNSVWRNFAAMPTSAAPENLITWQNICHKKHILINDTALFLDDLWPSAQMNDDNAYQQKISQWETHFFAPIWSALKSGLLPEMQIVCEQGILHTRKWSHWQFWKPRKKFMGQLS